MAGRQVFYPDGQRHEGKEYGGGPEPAFPSSDYTAENPVKEKSFQKIQGAAEEINRRIDSGQEFVHDHHLLVPISAQHEPGERDLQRMTECPAYRQGQRTTA